MKDLFLAHMALQLHQPADLFRSLMEPISASFPRSTYIKSQWATLRYDLLGIPLSTLIEAYFAMINAVYFAEYNEAEELFDELRNMNPYRLDDMDIFSNLLFVKDSKEKLSVLAHQSERIDKYRPETCCIIGKSALASCNVLRIKSLTYSILANYYSVKSEIAKSIEYFKKALKLNRNYHLAWTLLGHDYMEMKNSNAAIECYRRAISKERFHRIC
jgi:anaphase-promoting complex subunit 8